LKVLITGIAGNIGRATARHLLETGFEVRGIDVLPVAKELREAGLEMVYADVTDWLTMMRVMEGCDAVIHCAAYPTPHGKTASEVLRVNVIGTQNVLEAAVTNSVKKAIITSSIGALGFSFPKHPCLPDYLPVDAAHPRRPQDPYGLSKLMNEESASAATRTHGLTTIVIRPPWVGDFSKMTLNPWLLGRIRDAENRRDNDLWAYVDVHDLAEAYRLAIESDLTGDHVFFVTANDVIARATAEELVRRHFPEYVDDIPKLSGNTLYDIDTTRKMLGYNPTRRWSDFIKLDA